jgi:hypothetical protein
MMQYTTVQALGQARLAELHHQAQRDELARGRCEMTSISTVAPPGSALAPG